MPSYVIRSLITLKFIFPRTVSIFNILPILSSSMHTYMTDPIPKCFILHTHTHTHMHTHTHTHTHTMDIAILPHKFSRNYSQIGELRFQSYTDFVYTVTFWIWEFESKKQEDVVICLEYNFSVSYIVNY